MVSKTGNGSFIFIVVNFILPYVVLVCGVERHVFASSGQSPHLGIMPIDIPADNMMCTYDGKPSLLFKYVGSEISGLSS